MNSKIISTIVSDFEILNSFQIIFRNSPIFNFLALPSEIEKEKLIEQVEELIYSNYYTNNSNIEFEPYSILNDLITANKSKNKFYKGFKIAFILSNNDLIVENKRHKYLVKSGQYLLTETASLEENEQIIIYRPKHLKSIKDPFYHVLSTTLEDDFIEAEIRVYFNFTPKGAIAFTNAITAFLNKRRVPFHFKCLYDTKLFQRADNSVLYINNRYFGILIQFLRNHISEFNAYLNPSTPLFTYQIMPGISIAESPIDKNSFGKSRCKLLAEGIVNAYHSKIAKENISQYVEDSILSQGYSIDKFYLNPNSTFHYEFIF